MSEPDTKTPFKALSFGPDGWAQGVLCGDYPIARPNGVLDPDAEGETDITETVDDSACDAMLAAWAADGRPPILVDADHSSDLGDSTAAFAWVEDMRRCPDGIEVQLRPTDIGKAALDGRRFRYLSPVFPWDSFEYVDPAKRVGRPMRIVRFALTNLPRMRGIRPVVNAARPAAAAIHKQTNQKGASMDYKTMLCTLLGLDPATATDEQIQAASDAATAALAEKEANEAMNGCGIPDDKTVRNSLTEAFKADKSAGLNAIKAAGAAIAAAATAAKNADDQKKTAAQRALHAEPKKTPALNAGARFGDKSAALNAVIAANPGITRSDAYGIAKRQNPELFA